MYWTETDAGNIKRANLDGSEVETVLSGLIVPSGLKLSFGNGIHTSQDSLESVPKQISIQQIYPNPANGNTTFDFDLSEPSSVSLEVIDQLGCVVATTSATFYQPGRNRINLNASSLPNGVYFARLSSDKGFATSRFVVQR